MEIEKLLADIAEAEAKEIEMAPLGTDEHKEAIDNVAKITDRLIELKKMDMDDMQKHAQFKSDKRDKMIKNVIAAAGVVVPATLTVWGTVTFAKMEYEDGKMLTGFARGFANLFLPKK